MNININITKNIWGNDGFRSVMKSQKLPDSKFFHLLFDFKFVLWLDFFQIFVKSLPQTMDRVELVARIFSIF